SVTRRWRREHRRVRTVDSLIAARSTNRRRSGVQYRNGLAARLRMIAAAIGGIPCASFGVSASARPVGGTVAYQVHRGSTTSVTRRWRREHRRVRTLYRVIASRSTNRRRSGVYYRNRLAARLRMVAAAIGGIPCASLRVSASARPVGGTVADQVHRGSTTCVTRRWRREHRRVRTLYRVIGSGSTNRRRSGVYYRNRLAARL